MRVRFAMLTNMPTGEKRGDENHPPKWTAEHFPRGLSFLSILPGRTHIPPYADHLHVVRQS